MLGAFNPAQGIQQSAGELACKSEAKYMQTDGWEASMNALKNKQKISFNPPQSSTNTSIEVKSANLEIPEIGLMSATKELKTGTKVTFNMGVNGNAINGVDVECLLPLYNMVIV